MATYLEGVEDGRRDMLVRIEREAIAVARDLITDAGESQLRVDRDRANNWRRNTSMKLETMVGLIKQLSPEPQSWSALMESINRKAELQLRAEREEAKLAGAQVVS